MEPRILIVDDEADFLDTLQRRLSHRGFEVATAAGGPAALDALARGSFNVVILDVRMPGMDGLEVLKAIKEGHPDTEVILLTGHASIEAGIQGMSLGAYDYLLKPVEFDLLLEKIRQAWQRRRLAQG